MKTAVLAFALLSSPAFAATILVNGNANIYGAGHATPPAPAGGGAGTLPPSFTLGVGNTLTFSASGLVTYNGGGNFYGPEGALFNGGAPTNMSATGGISGISHDTSTMFLVGVFLNNQEPSGAAPSTLQFFYDGLPDLSPLLNQTFFIGDGWTGTGTGTVQNFFVPSGATRLFLGFADGNNFTGSPGTYGDNSGTITVVVNQTQTPEPSSLALLAVAAVGLASRRKRKTL